MNFAIISPMTNCLVLLALAIPLCAGTAVFASKRATSDTTLTADPRSEFWRDIKGITITTDYAGKPMSSNQMEVRSRWTAGNLYLLYICPYDELTLKPNPTTSEETNQLWNWDVAEAFLGSDFKDIGRYKEFQVSPQGEWVDLDIDRSPQKRGAGVSWNSGFEVKARIDEAKKIWYGAMKIPFSSLGVASPAPGTELRAGIYRCAGKEPERKLISWQVMEKRSFHIPERFAILRLVP